MRLLLLALYLLGAFLSTTMAAAITPRQKSPTIYGDPAKDMCKKIPQPTPDAIPDVCNIAFGAAGCKACDFQWASYNICGCYDNNTNCNTAFESTIACENTCFANCGAKNPITPPKSRTEICNAARSGSPYKECDSFFANCNIWNCYGSVYYGTADTDSSAKPMFCRYAEKCAADCAQKGNCKRH